MAWEVVLDIFLDALKDSALVFVFVFIVHIIISVFDSKIANFLIKRKKTAPIFGSLFGLIPQCGTSVLGADLYIKKYITIGTLVAIFLSCSDEAFIAILTSGIPGKMIMVLPLLGLKLGIGIIVGMLIDVIFDKHNKQEVVEADEVVEEIDCHSHDHEHSKIHIYLIHPLLHSLEIFGYVFVINMGLGLLMGWIGQDVFSNFLISNRYLTPLFSAIVGLIPNCASSLLISELFIEGNISFGALLAGLLVNSGLGMMILLKNKDSARHIFIIIVTCFVSAVAFGYIACLIVGF